MKQLAGERERERPTAMVMGTKRQRGQPSDRAKASKSVRLDDGQGFAHKFNKTGFKLDTERHLYYYLVKCYEQVLRGKEASIVLLKKEFVHYQRFAKTSRLKPLPDGFRDFEYHKKVVTLTKLIEEQVDAGVGSIVQQCEDGESVHGGKMEIDEGSGADLGPEHSINDTTMFPHGDARNLEDHPQGRPPTCHGQLPEAFRQCMGEFKRRAYEHLDILMEIERLEQQGTALMTKLRERDIKKSVGVNSGNTIHARRRLEEIYSQLEEDVTVKDPLSQSSKQLMEGINLQASYSRASYSQASNSVVQDVERDAEIIYTPTTKLDQDYAQVDPHATASQSLTVPREQVSISEALKSAPSYTGCLKVNLEEIHPPVAAGDLQYQLSKPMMEMSHPQASDLWGNEQYGGEYLMTAPHSQGDSISQIALAGSEEQLWNDEPLWNEGSAPSLLWTHDWRSPVRYK